MKWIVIRDDAGEVVGRVEIDPDDLEQFEAELPLGWYVDR